MLNRYSTSVFCALFLLLARGPAATAQPGSVRLRTSPPTEYARTQPGATTWSNAGSWVSGKVPLAGAAVAIDHVLTLDQNATVASLTVGSGAAFTASDATERTLDLLPGGVLTLAAGAEYNAGSGTLVFADSSTFRNDGSFGGGGAVRFAGVGTVEGAGSTTFGTVILSGSVDFGPVATISGELRLTAGGAVRTHAPTYAPGATLTYATGSDGAAPAGRALEWSAASGPGCPANVRLTGSTWLDLSHGDPATARLLTGNLLIEAGSGLLLGFGTDNMTQPLTALGSVTVAGTLRLSQAAGGDLRLGGDLTVAGTLVPNGRAVAFIDGAAQAVRATAPLTLDYLVLDKTGGQVMLSAPLTVRAPDGGTAVNFFPSISSAGPNVLHLNGQTLIIGTAGVASAAGSFAPGSGFTDTGAGALLLVGDGDFGTLRFGAGTALGTLTLDRTGIDGGATLGTSLRLITALNLTQANTKLTLGTENLTLAPTATIAVADANRYIVTGGTGQLEREGMGAGGLNAAQLFPVGTATGYNPATITNTGALDTYRVRVSAVSAYTPPSPTRQIERFWTITDAVPGGSAVTLRLQWTGTGPQEQEGADFLHDHTLVFTRNDGTGYSKIGARLVQATDPFVAEGTSLLDFSEWSVGNDNVLPVELYFFTGRMSGPDALLAWQTASERNSQLFDVERSTDGRRYERIGTLPGAGTTQTPHSYRFTDAGVAQFGAATLYYRLRQLDYDGSTTFSNIISIVPGQTTGSEPVIYPNMLTGDDFTLRCFAAGAETAELIIRDATGRLAHRSQVALAGGYNYIASRDLPGYVGLAPGIYAAHLALPDRRPVHLRLLRR